MVLWLFGALDLLSSLTMATLALGFHFEKLIIFVSAYLILKGLLFLKDFASMIDLIAGFLILFGLFTASLPKALLLIFAVLLFQKGATSFL